MVIYNEEKFNKFITENPFKFSSNRIERIKKDFYKPRGRLICDELVEFVLWANGYPARHEKFSDYLFPIIQDNSWSSVLEVGCGEAFLLSEYLYCKFNGKVSFTAIDKCTFVTFDTKVILLNEEFTPYYDISDYDAVIAQEPCEAAESIIKNCTENNKPFCVILCGVPHKRLTGELDENVEDWYNYLLNTYTGCKLGSWQNGRFSTGYIYSEKYFS